MVVWYKSRRWKHHKGLWTSTYINCNEVKLFNRFHYHYNSFFSQQTVFFEKNTWMVSLSSQEDYARHGPPESLELHRHSFGRYLTPQMDFNQTEPRSSPHFILANWDLTLFGDSSGILTSSPLPLTSQYRLRPCWDCLRRQETVMLRAVLCHPLHQISLETWLCCGRGMLLPCFVLDGFTAVCLKPIHSDELWYLDVGMLGSCDGVQIPLFFVFLWLYYTQTFRCGCHALHGWLHFKNWVFLGTSPFSWNMATFIEFPFLKGRYPNLDFNLFLICGTSFLLLPS